MKIIGKCYTGVTEARLRRYCAAPALKKPSSGNGSEEPARILKLINKICNFTTVALPDQMGLAIKLNECTECTE